MRRAFYIILLAAFGLCAVYQEQIRSGLSHLLVDQAFARQVEMICGVLDTGEVSLTELCSTPLPEVPALRSFFLEIKQKDGEWFKAHGWSYFPEVVCNEAGVSFTLMGREFRCGEKISSSRILPSIFSATVAKAEDGEGLIDRPQLSHLITLHPIPPLPSLLSFSATDSSTIKHVRALLVIDGQLLALPLKYHEPSNAYRGSFPSPFSSLEYQFQISFKDGRTLMTEIYGGVSQCMEPVVGLSKASQDALDFALNLQAEEQRLQYLVKTLTRIEQGEK